MSNLAVLVPALDCAGTIEAVVRGARSVVGTVLVVDDGSTDDTAERARTAGAEVVSHPANRGKGAALLTGMAWLRDHGFDRALTMDGDGQHLASEMPVMIAASEREPGALIVGARQLEGVEVAAVKLFGNHFANRWVEIACGQAIADTQSGFRVYPIGAVLGLGARSGHFAFETEVLVRAARARIPIRSVPIKAYYPPPEERISHYRGVRDTVRIILVVLGLILRLR